MTRRLVQDERQAELFRLPELPAPAKMLRRSTRRPKDDPPAPMPEMAEEVAARLTPVELDDLVRALPDEKLAHLFVAATRDLRRRLARAGPSAGPAPQRAELRTLSVRFGRLLANSDSRRPRTSGSREPAPVSKAASISRSGRLFHRDSGQQCRAPSRKRNCGSLESLNASVRCGCSRCGAPETRTACSYQPLLRGRGGRAHPRRLRARPKAPAHAKICAGRDDAGPEPVIPAMNSRRFDVIGLLAPLRRYAAVLTRDEARRRRPGPGCARARLRAPAHVPPLGRPARLAVLRAAQHASSTARRKAVRAVRRAHGGCGRDGGSARPGDQRPAAADPAAFLDLPEDQRTALHLVAIEGLLLPGGGGTLSGSRSER